MGSHVPENRDDTTGKPPTPVAITKPHVIATRRYGGVHAGAANRGTAGHMTVPLSVLGSHIQTLGLDTLGPIHQPELE